MAGKRRRSGVLITPRRERPHRYDSSDHISRNRSALLDSINEFYAAALDRLPVEGMPVLIPRLLKAGLCVGFLDPVSNILVNTISYKRVPERKPEIGVGPDGKAAARRRRQKALSRIVIDTSNISYHPPDHRRLRNMCIAFRSLEALVAFLTCYFRYLPTWEALQYLRLAKADLLTAVRLIEEDRNSNAFTFASLTTKTALRCAALAGCHPHPKVLVARSYSVASQMERVSGLLAMEGCLSGSTVENLHRLLKLRQKLSNLAGVSVAQLLQKKNKQPPFVHTKSLKSILIDKIYGFYLNALARLPRDDLRQRFHRGLLKSGHCYGPLVNPVYNIVLNTVWYETMFPPQEQFSVMMICSRSLVLVACRSLRGLVAFLRTCFCMLSTHQAMQYLLLTELNLWGAIEMARQEGYRMRNKSYIDKGYKVAATAARHPDPDALVKFYVSHVPRMCLAKQTEPLPLQPGGFVNVQVLSLILSQESPASYGSFQTVPKLSEGASRILSCIRKNFEDEQSFICRKVHAALKKYTERTRGPEYDLHIICGFNSSVVDNSFPGLHHGIRLRKHRCKLLYSHVNFLAIPRGLHSSDTVPMLFFAECCNDEDALGETSCWPVMGRPGRCFHCEDEGAKIVHPDLKRYYGCDVDFEGMACRNHLLGITNECIISGDEIINNSVDFAEEDCIYFDSRMDVKCAKFLNVRGDGKLRLY